MQKLGFKEDVMKYLQMNNALKLISISCSLPQAIVQNFVMSEIGFHNYKEIDN